MTVFRAATLRTLFFSFHAGAKEFKQKVVSVAANTREDTTTKKNKFSVGTEKRDEWIREIRRERLMGL